MKSILIMAAGNGSRYGTLKQFDQLGPNDEFLFEYTLYDAISEGFDHVVIVTKKEHVNNLKEYLSSRLPEKVNLDVIPQEISDLPGSAKHTVQRNKPWGTAHAVWTARNVIDDYFVVANADDYYGSDCMRLAMDFIGTGPDTMEFASVPYKLSETLSPEGSVSRAICIAHEDYLQSIDEVGEILRAGDEIYDKETSKHFSGEEVTSMNFWVFGPAIFNLIESDLVEFINSNQTDEKAEIYIPKQIQSWIEKGKARVRLTGSGSDWFGVTYAQDKIRAVKSLKQHTESKLYPSPLWNS